MTSAQQNVLELKTDRRRMDSPFEVRGSRQVERESEGRSARRKQEQSQLGGLTFQTVLVNSQTSDFRFKRLSRNPQFGSRA
jgi:hypothetical protein